MWFLSRLTMYRYAIYNEKLYLSQRAYLVRYVKSYFIIFNKLKQTLFSVH